MKTTTGFRVIQRLRRGAGAGEAGFVLVAFSLALLVILGCAGLTIDIGRMYVTRSEAQAYCDSAAMAAVLKLDGTPAGIASAKATALAVPKGWQFGTTAFDPAATVVDFATSSAGPWSTSPSPATGFNSVRVSTRVSLPLYLLPVLVGSQRSSIAAVAVAKQIELSGPGAGHYAPFSPFGAPIMSPLGPTSGKGDPEPMYWNDPFNMLRAQLPDNTLQHGGSYNIFWPNDSHVSGKWEDPDYVCTGEQYPSVLSLTTASGLGNSNRGYLYNTAPLIAATIIAGILPPGFPAINTGMDISPDFLAVSHGVMENNLTGGLADRVRTDTDSVTQWYSDYVRNDHGNNQRVLLMPINSGYCGATAFSGKGTTYNGANTCTFPVGDGTTNTMPAVPSYTVIGWGRFFLREASYYGGINGNKGVCAEYIGPGLIEGGGQPVGHSIYAAKLVQ